MINIIFDPNILLGFILMITMIILYFLRFVKPQLSRDEDIFFTTIGLVYSSIIIIHGWRLDPILLFSQILIFCILIPLGWENIRLRGMWYSLKKLKNKEK